MDTVLIILGSLLTAAGIVGCFLPVLPGPPLSYLGIISIHFVSYTNFSTRLLVFLGVLTVVVTILDYILPVKLTKKFGGTQAGIRGSTVGLIAGFFFGPIGIIVLPMVGAFIAEMLHNNNSNVAVRSAVGSFIGFLLSTGIKLTSSGIMGYYFVKELL